MPVHDRADPEPGPAVHQCSVVRGSKGQLGPRRTSPFLNLGDGNGGCHRQASTPAGSPPPISPPEPRRPGATERSGKPCRPAARRRRGWPGATGQVADRQTVPGRGATAGCVAGVPIRRTPARVSPVRRTSRVHPAAPVPSSAVPAGSSAGAPRRRRTPATIPGRVDRGRGVVQMVAIRRGSSVPASRAGEPPGAGRAEQAHRGRRHPYRPAPPRRPAAAATHRPGAVSNQARRASSSGRPGPARRATTGPRAGHRGTSPVAYASEEQRGRAARPVGDAYRASVPLRRTTRVFHGMSATTTSPTTPWAMTINDRGPIRWPAAAPVDASASATSSCRFVARAGIRHHGPVCGPPARSNRPRPRSADPSVDHEVASIATIMTIGP